MSWFSNRKAVVPIDFGDDSRRAVDAALEIMDAPADIHVIHVGTDLTATEPGLAWDILNDQSRRTNLEQMFRQKFDQAKYREVQFTLTFGDPGQQIAQYAEEIGAGIIIMPSHGRTGIRRLLIGSVAERVLRLAHCPVLILRQ